MVIYMVIYIAYCTLQSGMLCIQGTRCTLQHMHDMHATKTAVTAPSVTNIDSPDPESITM